MLALLVQYTARLIIAMPQSSSTSFEHELAKVVQLKPVQTFFCNRRDPLVWNQSFSGMHMHADACTHPPARLRRWLRSETNIYKQHLVPDPQNVAAILEACTEGLKAVLLTRCVDEVSHAYCERASNDTPPSVIMHKKEAMQLWRETTWLRTYKQTPGCFLHFTFDDLRRNRAEAVNAAARFFTLPTRRKYTPILKFFRNRTSARCDAFKPVHTTCK